MSIANKFNNYFVNIDPKLADNTDISDNSSYTDYLSVEALYIVPP